MILVVVLVRERMYPFCKSNKYRKVSVRSGAIFLKKSIFVFRNANGYSDGTVGCRAHRLRRVFPRAGGRRTGCRMCRRGCFVCQSVGQAGAHEGPLGIFPGAGGERLPAGAGTHLALCRRDGSSAGISHKRLSPRCLCSSGGSGSLSEGLSAAGGTVRGSRLGLCQRRLSPLALATLRDRSGGRRLRFPPLRGRSAVARSLPADGCFQRDPSCEGSRDPLVQQSHLPQRAGAHPLHAGNDARHAQPGSPRRPGGGFFAQERVLRLPDDARSGLGAFSAARRFCADGRCLPAGFVRCEGLFFRRGNACFFRTDIGARELSRRPAPPSGTGGAGGPAADAPAHGCAHGSSGGQRGNGSRALTVAAAGAVGAGWRRSDRLYASGVPGRSATVFRTRRSDRGEGGAGTLFGGRD